MNCKQCGQPLTKGNIKVVRKPGKRPYRVCRRCRYPDEVEVTRVDDKRWSFVRPPAREDGRPDLTVLEDFSQVPSEAIQIVGNIEDTGSGLQRPQDSTGGPVTVEGVLEYSEGFQPSRYRFFLQPASLVKLKRALDKGDAWLYGFASNWSAGITIEIVPVLEEVAEMNPEAVAHFIEIEFKLPTD